MKDNSPLISIITPTLNQIGFIGETIQSVLSQVVDVSFEYIVIDGGSTDGTQTMLASHGDLIRWISEPDSGQSDAINKGVAMARGEIIGWLNSDDLYLPGTLQKVADTFREHPRYSWMYGNSRMINEQGKEIRQWITSYKNRLSRTFRYEKLLVENFISQPSVFFRKETFLSSGGLDLSLHYAMDYDLWLRMAREGEPVYVPEDLSLFRLHPGSKSVQSYRNLFSEQYAIHLRYDQNPRLLFIHRIHIRKTLIVYQLLNTARQQNSGSTT